MAAAPSSSPSKALAVPDILVVDDEPDLLRLIGLRLTAAGYTVQSAASGEAALALFDAHAGARPRLVVTDLKMGGMDGLALFDALQKRAPGLPVIVLTAHGTIPDAVEAVQRGVFGFIPKPFEGSTLLAEVERALALSALPPAAAGGGDWREGIIAVGPAMRTVLERAELVAATDAPVLVLGASGSGKEVLAQAIHRAGPRAARPFVAINCAAIPEHLLESELFGHRKGAFTGAAYDHKGLFQQAEGGTVFLDEIGDMPLILQAKLLRVLQEREVRPVGAAASVPVDVRVISATHRNLEQAIAEGRFREDLYYRLNVVSLVLPLLSERREDIPALARHFLQQAAQRYGRPVSGFAPEALELLVAAPWPGNVRQLQNAVAQAVALTPSGVVPAERVREALRDEPVALTPLDEAKLAFERDYLVRLLKLTAGNVTQAARLAERNRTEFYRLLERHSLDPKHFKDA
ncbi:sigma 54-interacting transcriptional regulator [Oryzomicrobium sp.]|uniref:sigma 54-interacting transcriptional regulator n=1 Tax=Oryzomicrobium sp. TaxID=1911578 RepID=UPI0025DE9526|nr:sigma 54-interacting transcriptional regulator [Oryzomicrobium sp.]MCE1242616.1 sigma 54-interacting transcriptional regulator [Oryzomicrobium sp.]